MPAMALGAAVSAMAAQNIGAGQVGAGRPDHPRRHRPVAADHRRADRPADARRPLGARPVHGPRQPGAPDRPAHPPGRDLELPAVRGDDGAVRDGPRQRRGVGAADHPRGRAGAGPLRLDLRDLRLARRRRDLDQLPGDLADQPRAGARLLSPRRVEEGADDGRSRARTTTNAPRKRSPRASRAALSTQRAKGARMSVLPLPAHAPRPFVARGCARCSPRTGCTRATSSGRCSFATAGTARSRSARFPACRGGASTGSPPRRARPPTSAFRASPCSPTRPKTLRTEDAREALNPDNLICRAIKAIKDAVPEIGVLTDVALDPYTAHGHDGLIDEAGQRHQRRHGEGAGRPGAGPGRGRRRHRRAVGHDGRPRRRDPHGARRSGASERRDHGLCRQICVGLLRPVPRGGRQPGPPEGRQARLPDGPGQHRGGAARGRARPRRGRRLRDGQARACPISTSSRG